MDFFNYILIAFSFVYTAAVFRILAGISAASNKERRYIVHLMFFAAVSLLLLQLHQHIAIWTFF